MHTILRLVLPAVLVAVSPALLWAVEVPVRLNVNNEGGVFFKEVQSFKARRQRQMIPQSKDFSCGAAALATLLKYHYGYELTEEDAILGMFKHGEQEEIKRRGFSLLDMKRFVETLNYQGEGYKVPELPLLKKLNIPVITIIDTFNYKHFVVIRRVDDQYVYIADPSWGNRRIKVEEFDKIWPQKIIFVLQGPRVGTPEGLFAEGENGGVKVSEALRREIVLGHRFAMDPSEAIVFHTNRPLVDIMPFIPGTRR
uniref:Peptidase C39 n=1 Tax=Desulfobacca acetoxidans TaxID=60893 RepID=A0A7V4LDE0_9BACT